MKKSDLIETFGLVANIGVILGIVFLVIELNQANRLAKLQMRNDISGTIAQGLITAAGDDELMRLYAAVDNYDSMTAVEMSKFVRVFIATMRLRENMYYQYRNGLFDEEEYLAERESWRPDAESRFFTEYFYCRYKSNYSAGFMSELESMMPSKGC